jgi:hypothetical protein
MSLLIYSGRETRTAVERDVFPAFASHAKVKPVHPFNMSAKIEKRETPLREAYWARFDKLYPTPMYWRMNVQDVRTSGYPDSQLLGFKKASFWEFKHATPRFKTYGLQEITCQIINQKTFCRYVLFNEYNDMTSIWVVHPDQVRNCGGKIDNIEPEEGFDGFDFDALAHYMHRVHRP